MTRRYFGTDGVRGRVGKAPITPDFVLRLGQAAGRVLRRQSLTGHATVLIGKDTRVSGYMLEAALQAGFSSAGVDIVLCGPIPTPAVAYLTRRPSPRRGRGDLREPQSVRRQRHQVLLRRRYEAADAVELGIEDELDAGLHLRAFRRTRQGPPP